MKVLAYESFNSTNILVNMVSVLQREDLDESHCFCLSYNFFGNRLAMCFADCSIQVWECTNNKWSPSYKWHSNHAGAIYKVRWANPEFGSILATCSFDKTVNLFEENPLEKTWKKISQIIDSHEPIVDIQFAPVHLRLQLAVCSVNGEIRVYEPPNPVNLKVWNNLNGFAASKYGSNALAWNPSNLHPTMLLIGNNDLVRAQEKFILQNVGTGGSGRAEKSAENPVETLQLWMLSDDGKMWDKAYVPENGHEKSVIDISWAQLMGRNRHVVATADCEGYVIVWRIDARGNMEIEEGFRAHSSIVYSIGWDLMGTTLSTTGGDDNSLKVWKKNLNGKWSVMQEIKNK
jgi:WD40 repeat protein